MFLTILAGVFAFCTLFGSSHAALIELGGKTRTVQDVQTLELSGMDIVVRNFATASKRLLLLDSDGVLQIAGMTNDKKKALNDILAKLVMNKKNVVWIISGRPVSFLVKEYGDIEGLNLAGEHGLALANEKGEGHLRIPLGFDFNALTNRVRELAQDMIKAKEINFHENQGTLALTYDKKSKDQLAPKVVQLVDKIRESLSKAGPPKVAIDQDFTSILVDHIMRDTVVQIKPPQANKGYVAKELIDELGIDWAISLGDETVDEPMHKAVNELMRLHGNSPMFISGIVSGVMDQPTNAQFRLRNYEDVHQLLGKLADVE